VFAIASDLVVAGTAIKQPKGVSQAYADVGSTLNDHGFSRVQGSLYYSASEDLANLFAAISALKALPWMPASVRDIRAIRVDQWSDFTKFLNAYHRPAPLVRKIWQLWLL